MKTAADTEVKEGGGGTPNDLCPSSSLSDAKMEALTTRERGTERLEPAASFSQSCTMIFPLC